MKEQIVCSTTGVIVTFIINLIGGWSNALTLLCFLVGFDLVTGVLLATVFKNSNKTVDGKLSSYEFGKGIARKVMYIFYIIIGTLANDVLGVDYIRDVVIYSFIACELISLTENSILMGVPVPSIIKNFISIMKEKGDQTE